MILQIVALNNAQNIQCSYKPPNKDEVMYKVSNPNPNQHKRSLKANNIRIKIHYDSTVSNLPEEKSNIVKAVFPLAVDYWQKTLMVRNSVPVLRLSPTCRAKEIVTKNGVRCCLFGCLKRSRCGEVYIPKDHLQRCKQTLLFSNNHCIPSGPNQGKGLSNTDFVLYVSSGQTDRCRDGNTFAYAAHCQLEDSMDRPIAGYINLCPDLLGSGTPSHVISVFLPTIKHEFLHALGFSVSLYAFYRDQDGRPLSPRLANGDPVYDNKMNLYKWSDKIIRPVIRNDWQVASGNISRVFNMMITPNVLREARSHFNCSTLKGVELENQGNYGTAMTHWEKRILENEAMTGTHTQDTVFSRITLALMEDTGWYLVNYSMAEDLAWGKNLGCDFIEKSCFSWIQHRLLSQSDPSPYCVRIKSHPLITECSADRKSMAVCNLVIYDNPLSLEYQNFINIPGLEHNGDSNALAHYGGSVLLADYCPFIQEFIFKVDKQSKAFECQHDENMPPKKENFALEYYGQDSTCVFHSRRWLKSDCNKIISWYHYGSGCYKIFCNSTALYIQVLNYTFECIYQGQNISFTIYSDGYNHRGGLICPPCFATTLCNNNYQYCLTTTPDDAQFKLNRVKHNLPHHSVVTCRSEPTPIYLLSQKNEIIVIFIITRMFYQFWGS
ncbi:unnamed protein product [Gordionus sp. m RMFG-2023]